MVDETGEKRPRESALRRYLIVFQLGQASVERLRELAPRLQDVLQNLANQTVEPVFRSITADVFGYMMHSSADAQTICRRIESLDPGSPSGVGSLLENNDQILVVEVGVDSEAGKGFRAIEAWLQQTADS